MGKNIIGDGLMFKMLVVILTVIVCGVVEVGSLSKHESKKMNSLRKQATKSIQVPSSVSYSSSHLLVEYFHDRPTLTPFFT